MRFRDAKTLIATGIEEPSTFSKRSAGPPPLTARSAISGISRRGDTFSFTRTRSPSRLERPEKLGQVAVRHG